MAVEPARAGDTERSATPSNIRDATIIRSALCTAAARCASAAVMRRIEGGQRQSELRWRPKDG